MEKDYVSPSIITRRSTAQATEGTRMCSSIILPDANGDALYVGSLNRLQWADLEVVPLGGVETLSSEAKDSVVDDLHSAELFIVGKRHGSQVSI